MEKESHYLRHHELRIDATFLPHITQNNKFRVFGCRCCWLLAQRFCESLKQRQQKALFKTGSRILQDRCSVRTVTCAWAVWQRLSCGSTPLIPLRLSPPPPMKVSHGQALISGAVAQLCSLLLDLSGRQLFGRQRGDTLT